MILSHPALGNARLFISFQVALHRKRIGSRFSLELFARNTLIVVMELFKKFFCAWNILKFSNSPSLALWYVGGRVAA